MQDLGVFHSLGVLWIRVLQELERSGVTTAYPASFSAHRKLAQIRPKTARNPPPGQGCYPLLKEATQRLTRANKGYFCAEVLRDDTTSLRKRMCAFTACVRFLRRRGPAGLRSL